MEGIVVRWIKKNDVFSVLNLIKSLADFENRLEDVHLSCSQMEEDLFTPDPYCKCLVAVKESNLEIIGYCLFNKAYSTWRGKKIYLEDLYVLKDYRKSGIGKNFLVSLMKYAKENNVKVVHLACLDWNKESLDIYQHLNFKNISNTEGWMLLEAGSNEIDSLSNNKSPSHVRLDI